MKGLVFKDLLLMKKMNKKVIFVMYFLRAFQVLCKQKKLI